MPWVAYQTLIDHIVSKIKGSKGTLNGFNPTLLQDEIDKYKKRVVTYDDDEICWGLTLMMSTSIG